MNASNLRILPLRYRVATGLSICLVLWGGSLSRAQQPMGGPPLVRAAERPFSLPRPMHEVDLRVPGLAELSGAATAHLAEIPDYSALAFQSQPVELVAFGGSRPWTTSVVNWEAPAFCHRPLYFEEANLERYGYSWGRLQPAVSAGGMLGRTLALPYLMAIHLPHQCIYTLGQPRPGDAVPFAFHVPPPSLPASASEAAAAVALIALIP